ncbi:MAG TPA: hypothetical protein VGK88_00640 [bacterium]
MNRAWIVGIVVLVVLVAIGVSVANNAYQAGLAQGLSQSAQPGAPPQPGAGPYPYYGPWRYGWFGHGFGFGFLFPLLFLFLIFGLLRGLWFWGRGGPGYWHRGPSAGGGVPPWFEEWHRRAHEGKQDTGTA